VLVGAHSLTAHIGLGRLDELERLFSSCRQQCAARREKGPQHPPMSSHRRVSRLTLPTRQVSLWPLGDRSASDAPAQLPAATGAGAKPPDDDTASLPHGRTPSFVCEIPLRVSPADKRVVQAGWKQPGLCITPAWEKPANGWV
jgi:hypothetical protein